MYFITVTEYKQAVCYDRSQHSYRSKSGGWCKVKPPTDKLKDDTKL